MQRSVDIVLLEPDDLIRGLVESWLSEAGYCVTLRALHRLTAHRRRPTVPRLIISDVRDPRTAGAAIHSLREAYASPILLISARFRRGLGSSVETARRLRVCGVLPKPFSREELLSAVTASLDPGAPGGDTP